MTPLQPQASDPADQTATITIPKIRDGNNQPTCFYYGKTCPFYMQSGFGTREHCFWRQGAGKYPPLLQRRDNGTGTNIPHDQCPVWTETQP
jgi:hypothetical protein